MGLFRNRPFALALACFLGIGLLSTAFLIGNNAYVSVLCAAAALVVLACLAIAAAVFLVRRDRVRAVSALLAISLSLMGGLRVGLFFSERYARPQGAIGEVVSCSVCVLEREFLMPGYSRYLVDVKSDESCCKTSNFLPRSFRAVLVSASETHFAVGDTLQTEATVIPLTDLYTDPSVPMANGASVGLLPCETVDAEGEEKEMLYPSADASTHAAGAVARVMTAFAVLRTRLSFILTESAEGSAGQLAAAVLLGDRSALDPSVTRDFGRAGIAHLLALSGMHMSILIGGAVLILRRLGVSRRVSSAVTILLILGFLLLTGFPMSACRAGLMLLVFALLGFLSHRPDPITSLFLAVSVVVAIFPAAVFSVGLWMSFSSVLGLLLLMPRFERMLPSRSPRVRAADGGGHVFPVLRFLRSIGARMLRALLLSLGVSLIASFSILPVLWLSGGEFALFSMLSNLLTVPLMPIFLLLSLFLLLFWRIAVLLPVLSVLLRAVGGYLTAVAGLISQIPHASVSLRYPFADAAVLAFFVPTVLLCVLPESLFARLQKAFGRRRKRKERESSARRVSMGLHGAWLLVPVMISVLIYGIGFSVHSAEVHDACGISATVVGASKGELIVFADCGGGCLIDASDGRTSGYREACAAAREMGVTEWETVVIPYLRKDHLTAVSRLCKSEIVRTVLVPTPTDENAERLTSELLRRLTGLGVTVRYLTYETATELCGAELTVLKPHLLERSAYPVYGLSILKDGERLTYLSQAVNESPLAPQADRMASESDLLIYGSYGPRRKELYKIPQGQARMILLSGTENGEALAASSREAIAADAGIELRMYTKPYRVRIGAE